MISAVVAASQQYEYRSRVQLKTTTRRGVLQIGFYQQGSHVVTDVVDGCPLSVPKINAVLERCRSILATFSDVQAIQQISIDAGEQEVVVVIHYAGNYLRKLRAFLVERSADFEPCTGLYIRTGAQMPLVQLWGSNHISYFMPALDPKQKPLLLTYLPGGFAQINRSQNAAMLSVISRLADFAPTENLLDLYCGNGNFSIPLAAEVASVVGVEGFADSIRAAEFNCLANGVDNAEFICMEVNSGVRRLLREGRTFDTILLDPPRAGAGDSIPGIAALNPYKIIYVSCDPGTLARDIGIMTGFGYRVVESVPLDMFPQTYHLESVTLLIKL